MKKFAQYIIACNGLKIKKDNKDFHYIDLEHQKDNENRNVRIELQNFSKHFYSLKNTYKDLLEIAGYVFAADRKSYRGKPDDLEYHRWSRKLHFHIKVRDIDFWNNDEVKECLNETLSFMAGDLEYKFTFYKAEPDEPTSIFDNDEFSSSPDTADSVILFSGGLDSLAGIIEKLETTKDQICLVSHQSGQTSVKSIQNTLFEMICINYWDRCKHYKFECGLTNTNTVDETQRTRAFLYNSISFALSSALNLKQSFIYENGITSLNFAVTQDLMNGRTSRTTHPKTLATLEKLFTLIACDEYKIINPYFNKTKTEVIQVLKNHDRLDLIKHSVSCSTSRNHSVNSTHCGICSQCIDRRFASFASKIIEHDNGSLYDFNFLTESIENGYLVKMINDYIRIAQEYSNFSFNGFYIRFAKEILDVEPYVIGDGPEERIKMVYNLCQRHAKQIEDAIGLMVYIHNNKALAPKNPKSFFSLIIEPRLYQKPEPNEDVDYFANIKEEYVKSENVKKLKNFKRGELKEKLKKFVKTMNLEKYETVPSSKIALITRKLRKEGYDAKESSISSVLRKMDYSYSKE